MACATCHDPAHAYGPPNDLAVQLGGPHGTSPGLRADPFDSLQGVHARLRRSARQPRRLQPSRRPAAGFAWDGRADSLAEQAKAPLLSPFEMANANAAERGRAAARFAVGGRRSCGAFGAAALADVDVAFGKVQLALQSFQIEDPSFHPYNSKYDLYLYKKPGGELTPAEERGLKVFKDKKTGNCPGCHLADASLDDGAPAAAHRLFVRGHRRPAQPGDPRQPRPHATATSASAARCATITPSFPEYCGLFKTPTLRNVATRRAFFHNGVIHSLEQAVRFYNTRDTRPELWYPTVGGRAKAKPDPDFPRYGLVTTQYVGGTVQKYDDLPAAAPQEPRQAAPARRARGAARSHPMTEQQVGDLLCFLQTLTDADIGRRNDSNGFLARFRDAQSYPAPNNAKN